MGNDYYSLKTSKAVLVADIEVIYALISSGRMDLLSNLYEKVYTTPDIYSTCQRTLGIDELKDFRSFVTQIDFSASRLGVESILELSDTLTEDDAYAMLCGMMEKIDVVLDDPRKAALFVSHSVNTLRISDILSAAAVTKKRDAA